MVSVLLIKLVGLEGYAIVRLGCKVQYAAVANKTNNGRRQVKPLKISRSVYVNNLVPLGLDRSTK
jgi:hypothetical protein